MIVYTLQWAASMLKVSVATACRWIAHAGVRTMTIETDRARKYVSQQDLINLAVMHQREIGSLNDITDRPKKHPDPDLYTLAEVAKFLDVSCVTLRAWLTQANIEARYIKTDQKRRYLNDRDIAALVYRHRWNRKYGRHTNSVSAKDQVPYNLCSLRDAARYLGVDPRTVKKWLDQYEISKTSFNGIRGIYIDQCDLQRLAELHPKKPVTLDLCTLNQATQYLGVTRSTIETWMVRHHMPKYITSDTGQGVYIHYTDVIRLEKLHPGAPTDKTLLSVKEVAQYLGVATDVVRKWLTRYDIPKQTMGPNGQRIYIHCTDLVTLERLHPDKSKTYKQLLTQKEAAAHLGIDVRTLQRRLEQYNLPIYGIGTGGWRTYVHYDDVVKLEQLHPTRPADKDLWTIKEVAQYLGVSTVVVRNWLTRHDIPRRIIGTGRQRIYIHHADVLTLEALYPKVSPGQDLVTQKEAIEHLGISKTTLKRWMAEENLSKCVIGSSGKCVYVRWSDVLLLGKRHGRL